MVDTRSEQAIALIEQASVCLLEATALLRARLSNGHDRHSKAHASATSPYVDPATFCVRWRGRTCNLGATLPFHLLDRLCRRSNCFVCPESLLQDVWRARKSHDTVRSTVCRLKRRLEAAGMDDLASRIRCEGGSYALMLGDCSRKIAQQSHRNAP